MPKRSRKPRDLNRLASAIVDQATSEDDKSDDPYEGKDRTAVDAGRKGGSKGGRVRAQKLSPDERSRIARAAAEARWEK